MKIKYIVDRDERKLCKDGYQRIKKKHTEHGFLTLDLEATFETGPWGDKRTDEKTDKAVREAVYAEAKAKYPDYYVYWFDIVEY